jgi:para-nitrobenzyl esterase
MGNSTKKHLVLALIPLVLFSCSSSSHEVGSSSQGMHQSEATLKNPLVRQTAYGLVEGIEYDASTYAWLGIPYAKPPVGELRWRAPKNPDPWEGIKPANGFCSACPQYGGLMGFMDPDAFGKPVGSEDCLYLNIWRPKTEERGLPVLFWIHGGGNYAGQADMTMYYGAHFAAGGNMLFVSINYRLGPLGWFTHPALRGSDPIDGSGNYGTLDIINALQWVHANIVAFGGDPHNITIAGQSAGGMNVFSLLVSPLTTGLFQRAIAQSGFPGSSALSSGDKATQMVLEKLLINDGLAANADEAKAFLKGKDNAWIASYLRSKTFEEIYTCFEPSLAGMLMDAGGSIFEDGVVIPERASDMFKKGAYQKVPLIVGNNRDEAKTFLPLVVSKLKEGDEPVEKAFYRLIMTFDPDHPDLALSDILDPIWVLLYDPLADFSDTLVEKTTVDDLCRTLASYQNDLYVYAFAWDEEPEPLDVLIGAGHAIEIPFAFGNFGRGPEDLFRFAWSASNRPGREQLSAIMIGYWSRFARTGNPNTPGVYAWKPWSNKTQGFKRIILDTDLNSQPLPTPPGQPDTGYGSYRRYICDHYTAHKIDCADGTSSWYYVPEKLKNMDKAPVLIILHGFSQIDPTPSMGQIRHYVRQGYLVVFPQFNLPGTGILKDLDQNEMLKRAIVLTNRAIDEMGSAAETEEVFIVGHSLGGLLAMGWIAEGGLWPKAMILQNPSVTNTKIPEFVKRQMTFIDYKLKGPLVTCPVILLSAQEDDFAPLEDTMEAYMALTNVPSKVLYMVQSDYHGKPSLKADHCAPLLIGCSLPAWGKECPLSSFIENTLDFRVYYAATDAMLDGKASVDFTLGVWSDGVPVKPVETLLEYP